MEKIVNNIEQQKTYKSLLKKILVVFLAIQPILDIYMNLFDQKIQVAGVSLATVFRFALLFGVLATIVFNELKRKSTLLFIVYAAIVAVYAVLHHINASTFSVELAQAEYNMLGEILYLARMCLPMALIYIVYILKPDYKDIKAIVVWSSFTISLVIIATNLLKIGFIAYAVEDIKISGTMANWFTSAKDSFDWWELSCRGIFQSTNQLSGVCMILCPVLAYICFAEKKIKYWIVLAMHIVGMINLSTRIAAFGGIAIFCGVVVIYILERIIHKQIDLKRLVKCNSLCVVLCLIVALVFVSSSPILMRADEGGIFDDISINIGDINNTTQTEAVTESETAEPEDTDSVATEDSEDEDDTNPPEEFVDREYMLEYIEANLATAGLQDVYFRDAYPYTEDVEFWYHIIKDVPEYERYGNRNMRGFLIDRIFERDGRVSNSILGISYTRSSSFVWPERDIETQLDALGIVGTLIFIGPYFIVLLCGVIEFFKRFFNNLYLKKVIYLITAGIGVATAYLSGHVMNEVFPSFYLALFCGIVMNVVFADKRAFHCVDDDGGAKKEN